MVYARRIITNSVAALLLSFLTTNIALGQGVINDLLSGKLNDPSPGQWVWYTVSDINGETLCSVRQAVIGKEKVGNKEGFWVEFEIVPTAGYKTVYKMLLVGPASDPRNVKRVLCKQGLDPIQEIDTASTEISTPAAGRARKKSLGMETVETGSGPIRGEHVEVTQNDRVIHIWLSPDIKPTGIVKLQTAEGEMVLRNSGVGGTYGQSVLDATEPPALQVKTSVDETDDIAKRNEENGPSESIHKPTETGSQ